PVVPLFVEQRPLLGHALACQQLAHTARRLYDIFDEPCDEPDEPLADAGIQNAALDRRALTVPVRARRIREPWSKRAIRLRSTCWIGQTSAEEPERIARREHRQGSHLQLDEMILRSVHVHDMNLGRDL